MSNLAPNPSDIAAERQKYIELIARLEGEAARDPQGYRRKLRGLAAVGYGYVFLLLALGIALLLALLGIVVFAHKFNVVMLKIGFFVAVFDFILLKSLFVKLEPPDGLPLNRQQAPRLFEDVADISHRLAAPMPYKILLTEEFNAAAAQVPRFGLVGPTRNYLVVGLPLLATLSREEFQAVVAHEFGHFSGNHSKFSNWIYRVRMTWAQIVLQLQENGNLLFSKFLDWYWPLFSAYSFAMVRQDEFEADRCAAELTRPGAIASALVRINVVGGYLGDEWWPKLFSRAATEPEPPSQILRELTQDIRGSADHLAGERWLTRALNTPPEAEDTHPSLAQRLAALEQKAEITPLTGPTALDYYLGEEWQNLAAPLDAATYLAFGESWRARHAELGAAREKLSAIESRTGDEEISLEDEWLRAEATEELGDEQKAFTLYETFVANHPEEARGHFALGRLRLKRGEDSGLGELKTALELDHHATLAAAELSINFLLEHGRTSEVDAWRHTSTAYEDKLACAQVERSSFTPKDFLLAPELSAEFREKLHQHFAQFEEIVEVYLVRKKVQHFPEIPFLVGGIIVQKKSFTVSDDTPRRAGIIERATQGLELEDLQAWLDLDAEGNKDFKKLFKDVKGALIYEKAK